MDKLKALGGLRFTLTQEMEETILNMLVIQQMLDESEISSRERKLLEKQKDKLFKYFRVEFQKYNVEQVAIYRAFMSK